MAGLPNITGYMGDHWRTDRAWYGGALYMEVKSATYVDSDVLNGGESAQFRINASRSSSIYGKSSTVTPLSLSCVFLISY